MSFSAITFEGCIMTTQPLPTGADAPKYDCEMGDPLDMLAEECAEVIQAIMKARRFSLDGAPSYTGIRPREEIVKEIGDVLACIELLMAGYGTVLLNGAELDAAKNAKLAKISEYFRHPTVRASA